MCDLIVLFICISSLFVEPWPLDMDVSSGNESGLDGKGRLKIFKMEKKILYF